MITWEQGGARELGAGLGRGLGPGGDGGTHRDLAGVLVADLLHLLTAVGCGRRSGGEAGSGSSVPFAPTVLEGRPGPTSPKPPPPGPSGRPGHRTRLGGPRPESASQLGVRLEADVTGLTSPSAGGWVAPPTPQPPTPPQIRRSPTRPHRSSAAA